MTPYQTFGQAAAPSNMQFPTAAYLQSAQNAAEIQVRGMDAMGKGIAGAVSSVAGAYNEHKQEQAKFNATKKMVDVFGNSLNEAEKESIASIFADTSMSVKEKNALAPALMQFLAASQQQKGREEVSNIMAGSRIAAAGARRPPPMPGSTFGGVPTLDQVFGTPMGQPQASPNFSDLPANPSQGNPGALMPQTQQGQPASRIGSNGQMEVWSSRLNKYVEIDNPMQDIHY